MYAITGITGNIGSEVARNLLASNLPLRAVVRDPARAKSWAEKGCEVAQSDILAPNAATVLTAAFQGAEAVFILIPPLFDPAPGFPEAHAMADALYSALDATRPARTVYLSTIGAQAAQTNLLSQHTIIETRLRALQSPITFLRPAWFMENTSWDIAPARETGIIPSFLQPLDRPISMVATADIGRLAAELLQENHPSHRIVELEGPTSVSPNQVAATFTELLRKPITVQPVPREDWKQIFNTQGMKNPNPRIAMLDGFNQGWIDFEGNPETIRKGTTTLKTVIKTLLGRTPA